MNGWDIADSLTALGGVCLFAAAPGWSFWRLARDVHRGTWRSSAWFWRATWTSLYLTAGTWLWGLFSQVGIRDYEDACRSGGQPFDAAYTSDAHKAAREQLFPLSDPCNVSYDLVPAWVNPTCVVFALAFAASLGGVVATLLERRRSNLKHRRCNP
jgi:hypothetical protein